MKALGEGVIRVSNGEYDEGYELLMEEEFIKEHKAFVAKLSQTSEIIDKENNSHNSDDGEEDFEEENDEEVESESITELSVPPVATEHTRAAMRT